MFKINLVKLLGSKKQDCCEVQIVEVEEEYDGSENEQDDKCCAK